MLSRQLLLAATAGFAVLVFQPARAQTQAALTGTVSSAEEGKMEGVVVSAKKDGSTITVSVVTNAQGQYSFPAARLGAGHYSISMKANGYDLAGAAAADVAAGKTAAADLKLVKTKNLTAQLSNAEWLESMPGTKEQKQFLLNCTSCHTLERIVKSTHDSEEFAQVIKRMSGYYPGSTPTHPQRLVNFTRDRDRGGDMKKITDWMASINLSQQTSWNYQLKTMPRLTGKSTHVIITEYDLPEARVQPHDVMLDSKGTVWYSDFGQMHLGKMDPKTGKVVEYTVPASKKDYPTGSLNLEIDKQDNLWLGVMYQAEIVKFDPKTEKWQSWPIPKEWDSNGAQFGHLAVYNSDVDGKVWIKNSDGTLIYRMDLASGKFENLGAPNDPVTGKKIGTYGLHSDAQNNIYLLDFGSNDIAKIDAKSKALTIYKTPTPNSHPRRGRVDVEGRVWFAEYLGDAIGVLDPKSGEIKEYKSPTPWSSPYDAMAGKNDAWTGSMSTDRVTRVDIKSGQVTDYPLPHRTNIRRVFVDDRTSPATLWVGNNHGAAIVKVEPLD
jgi:virginiamycin B lyase